MRCVQSALSFVVDHYQLVIDMKEKRLDSIEQLAQFQELTSVRSSLVFGDKDFERLSNNLVAQVFNRGGNALFEMTRRLVGAAPERTIS